MYLWDVFVRCICKMYLCSCAVEDGLGGYKLAVTVARFTPGLSANSKPSIQQVPPEIILLLATIAQSNVKRNYGCTLVLDTFCGYIAN